MRMTVLITLKKLFGCIDMKDKKQIIWMIVLLGTILLFLITGCKPKQIINERIITRVDSAAVLSLQEQLEVKDLEIDNLKSDLQLVRSENTLLQNEVSTKTTKYDTSKPIVPETGKPPVSEETHTESKTSLEKKLSETETENKELRKENTTITTYNSNLQYQVEQLKNENRTLKARIIPVTLWQKIIGYVYGCFVGIVIGALLWWRFGNTIKSFRLWKK